MNCRHCNAKLAKIFVDLGTAPPSNSFLSREQLSQTENRYPLKLFVCEQCLLVQVPEHASAADIFAADYVYFSSFSASWVEHARLYVEGIVDRLKLGHNSLVIEIAANDGYLLQHVAARKIPCLGIEPAEGPANAARAKNIDIRTEFFGRASAEKLSAEGKRADLIVGNNVFAHVPDVNDFAAGLARALKASGTITLEFPHLLNLIAQNQFDTIYHEHFSYFSLGTANRILGAQGLSIYDVDEIPTHGGSLRIYAAHKDQNKKVSRNVEKVFADEHEAKIDRLDGHLGFQAKADKVRDDFRSFLIAEKRAGRTVAGYGAAAKGNTLLNYAGITPDLVAFVADASPHKQGKFLPGSHIPVVSEMHLRAAKPDIVVLFPWNLADELRRQLADIGEWGGRFAVAVPELKVWAP